MTNQKTEPIEVTVRGVKARIYGAASNPGCAWIADKGLRALNKQGKWTRASSLLSSETMWPSPADALAFVEKLNGEPSTPSLQAAAGETPSDADITPRKHCNYCDNKPSFTACPFCHWNGNIPPSPPPAPIAATKHCGENRDALLKDPSWSEQPPAATDEGGPWSAEQKVSALTSQLAEARREVDRLRESLTAAQASLKAAEERAEKSEAACVAYRHWLITESGWENFREEYSLGDTARAKNAKTLRDWLAANNVESVGRNWLEGLRKSESAREAAEKELAQLRDQFDKKKLDSLYIHLGRIASAAIDAGWNEKNDIDEFIASLQAELEKLRSKEKLPDSVVAEHLDREPMHASEGRRSPCFAPREHQDERKDGER